MSKGKESQEEEIGLPMGEPIDEDDELIFDGKNWVSLKWYTQEITKSIPTTSSSPSVKKEDLAKQMLVGLYQIPKINTEAFNEISKEVKKENEVKMAPSLQWMLDNGYLCKVEVQKRRPLYVITEKASKFAELVRDVPAKSHEFSSIINVSKARATVSDK